MKTALRPVLAGEKGILGNLLEKYTYELSQYDHTLFDSNGLYGYPYLDSYWQEEGRFAYFIDAGQNLAGFALINRHPACSRPIDWAVAEFFVACPYRRQGIASAAMEQLFQMHKGYWHIQYHPENTAGAAFWQKISKAYADGTILLLEGDSPYPDGAIPQVLFFKI